MDCCLQKLDPDSSKLEKVQPGPENKCFQPPSLVQFQLVEAGHLCQPSSMDLGGTE